MLNTASTAPMRITLKEYIKRWRHEDWDATKERHDWPRELTIDKSSELCEKLRRYLTVNNRGASTCNSNEQGVLMFFSLFDIEGEFCNAGFLAKLYVSDLLEEAFSLPLLSARYSHTRKVAQALAHFVEQVKQDCMKKANLDARWEKEEKILRQIQSLIVQPVLTQANSEGRACQINE